MKLLVPVESLLVAALVLVVLVLASRALAAETASAPGPVNPSPQQVAKIAEMLAPEPKGIGRPISDRQFWQDVARNEHFAEVVTEAEQALGEPMPVVTQEDFDAYAVTGRREQYDRANGKLSGRYTRAVLAECIEDKGRFLADIEACIRQICQMPTWVPPQHNGIWVRKEGDTYIVDLVSSKLAASMATGDYWLGEKIDKSVRKELHDALQQRILGPYRAQVEGKAGRELWWLARPGVNNWNAVCNAGVAIAALTTVPDRSDRAFFIAAAENSLRCFVAGFTDDGYCSEGLGYWNYGFSHYVMLADVVFGATGGKLDLMADPKIRQMALFGTRMEIAPGIYPVIADATPGTRPMGELQNYIARKYDLGLTQWIKPLGAEAMRPDVLSAVLAFPAGLEKTYGPKGYKPDESRDWFDQAQFYIGRPGGGKGRLAVACKGGHNNEAHNHNDVGTYMVVQGAQCPLVDPGAPVYTAKTFSSERYTDDIINSWGHPVPLVAGKKQETGAQARATVLEKTFTDQKDTLVLDIKAAYDVPELKSLKRTFVYDRQGEGGFTVTDEVEFSKPTSFGTAMITFGQWKESGDLPASPQAAGTIMVADGGESVNVAIDAGGAAYKINAEPIKSEVRGDRKPVRIGVDLSQPVSAAKISIRVTPGVSSPTTQPTTTRRGRRNAD